ncbi:MAG: dihydrolipoamide dehydrogenase [Actinomycetota bacterium]|jgi:dihydrolipoamide dehydrogenase|nr:dihydrolipoamide dehydrogenase [Actinomycetota bacterium]
MGDGYDVVVIGAGTGGYSAALRAAQLGKHVAIVERDDRLGGTCLLRGCIPTKALLQSAAVMDTVNRSDEWGIKASGEPDWSAVKAFEQKIVDKLVSGVTGLISHRGIDVLSGSATLLPGPAVEVDGATYPATDVVIATGSRPRLLPGIEISERVITSDEALWFDRIPSSAVVIGAGAVGLEFASLYRSLGADVTVLEALPRLAPLEDEEVSKEIAKAFRKRGIASTADASVTAVKEEAETVEVSYESGGSEHTVAAEICLVAIGRGPVSDGLGLEAAGVSMHERGFVDVDDHLRTTAAHVWAVGDVAATPLQLAHVAFTEGMAVAERLADIDVPPIDYANIPKVTYCSPEMASVGLTEAQARERGHEVVTEKFDFRGIGKANMLGETGFVKVVAQADGGPVLGVHMIGPHVTDLIAEGMLITSWEASPAEVAAMIHPHPSLSEAIGEAMLALAGKPLHSA